MAEKIRQRKALIIGGSAGSLRVILQVLKGIRADLNLPVIIVMHRKNDPSSGLIDILAQSSELPAKEAEDKDFILPGQVYLAPAGYHLLIERDLSFSLDGSELVNFSRPSIDVSFQTAAEAYGAGLLAIVLSGANHDGTSGSKYVREYGGIVIAQDTGEAETPFMPHQIISNGLANHICTTVKMLELINGLK